MQFRGVDAPSKAATLCQLSKSIPHAGTGEPFVGCSWEVLLGQAIRRDASYQHHAARRLCIPCPFQLPCPWSCFRWRPSAPHGLPIPTPSEKRTMPVTLTHALRWSVRSSVSTRAAATARPRPNPASMPIQNLGPACDQSRQAAGRPKNDGRSDGFLVS